jgi:hypothetical protein
MLIAAVILYALCVWVTSRLPKIGPGSTVFFGGPATPHVAFAIRHPLRHVIAIGWGVAITGIMIGGAQTGPDQQQAILLVATAGVGILSLLSLLFIPVILKRQHAEEPVVVETENAGSASETSQLLVCGPEEVLISLQEDPRLTLLLSPVAMPCFRVAPPEAEPLILAHNLGIVTISWDAALTDAIFGAYAAAIEAGDTQAEKALDARTAAAELTEQLRIVTAELATSAHDRQDLGSKLASVRTRHRGVSSVDFSLMPADALRKERDGLLKQIRTIDDVLRQKDAAPAPETEELFALPLKATTPVG